MYINITEMILNVSVLPLSISSVAGFQALLETPEPRAALIECRAQTLQPVVKRPKFAVCFDPVQFVEAKSLKQLNRLHDLDILGYRTP